MKNFVQKFPLLLAFLLIGTLLTACSNKEEQPKPCDDAFLKDFVSVTCQRFDIANEYGTNGGDLLEVCNKAVDVELSKLEKYTQELFSDTVLQEKAIEYINLLHEEKEALTYYNVDYVKCMELWDKAQAKRAQAIEFFVTNYELQFPEKYESALNNMLTKAKLANQEDELKTKTDGITESISFELERNEYGIKTYTATIENTTDQVFSSIVYNINLLDKDGVIVESQAAYASNVNHGQKAKIDFMTTSEFDTYEITGEYYTK